MSTFAPFDPWAVFERASVRWPDRPALRVDGRTWSYAELHAEALIIANWCDSTLPPAARVGLLGLRSVTSYAGVLGILYSGRSYVPLHPDHPPERWQQCLQQAAASGLVAPAEQHERLRSLFDLPLNERSGPARGGPVPGQEAYVMFTSGSTGGPKGVPVGRSHVSAYLEHALTTWDIRVEDRCTQLFSLGFDLSVHDLFVCWGSGACLCVPADDNALRLSAYVQEEGVTVWFSVPSVIALLHRMRALKGGAFPTIRRSFFCGEALRWPDVKAWSIAAPNSSITNLYGPTEATIAILEHPITAPFEEEGVVPIGRPFPMASTRVEPTDGDVQIGELWLAGPQVTTGYVGRPDETRKAYVASGQSGPAWYRTGDRVRKDAGSVYHYLGRIDEQVKIAGHRVEPGEVDACLAGKLSGGRAVTVSVERNGMQRLVTFIDVPMDTAEVARYAAAHLPAYMVPEQVLVLNTFPMNSNGKVDKVALKERARHA